LGVRHFALVEAVFVFFWIVVDVSDWSSFHFRVVRSVQLQSGFSRTSVRLQSDFSWTFAGPPEGGHYTWPRLLEGQP
jgi:hypothetical protein